MKSHMKPISFLNAIVLIIAGTILVNLSNAQNSGNAIQPYPENPYYWQYEGEPVVLLGGTKDDNLFQIPDLKSHLKKLSAVGGNYVRNTMSDRHSRGFEVYPFKKLENGKYDLNQWNKEYWKRFENLLKWTSKMDIIVQIEVWDRFDYSRENWIPHPYNPNNNINYTYEESGFKPKYPKHPGANVQPFFFTTPQQSNNQTVLKYQQRFVNKMLDYSLEYPNVLYCIDNETSGEEAWSVYWARFIRERSEEEGVTVNITEMWDEWNLKAEQHRRTFDHPERFDFVDISQNNHQTGETHWENFQWVRDYLSNQPRPLNSVKIYGSGADSHGGSIQDAVEKFWRWIIGGAASARFHRPNSGIGLSKTAQTQIRSARMFLEEFNIVDARPDSEHKLLSKREENEAYLTRIPGEQYAVYFTNGGEVSLELSNANGSYKVKWLDVSDSEWKKEASVNGGRKVSLETPGEGQYLVLLKTMKQ
jgi:hypothetical protein